MSRDKLDNPEILQLPLLRMMAKTVIHLEGKGKARGLVRHAVYMCRLPSTGLYNLLFMQKVRY